MTVGVTGKCRARILMGGTVEKKQKPGPGRWRAFQIFGSLPSSHGENVLKAAQGCVSTHCERLSASWGSFMSSLGNPGPDQFLRLDWQLQDRAPW